MDAKWEEGFRRLSEYAFKHGQAQMPQNYTEADRYRLGSWVTTQRTAYDRGTLSAERQRRLEELPGWSWDPGADAWEEHYVQLLDYVKQYGTSRVPQQYQGRWFPSRRMGAEAAQQLRRRQAQRRPSAPPRKAVAVAVEQVGLVSITRRTCPSTVAAQAASRPH